MRKQSFHLFGLVGGASFALLIVNITLWALPVQDGLFIGDTDPDWPAFHFVPNMRFTHSDGWNLRDVVRGQTNNLGYVAPFDYTFGDKGIIVLGDSFVESAMNTYSDSLQGQLKVPTSARMPIMNFGYSGASLSDYVGVASLAGRKFRADWVIVVIVPGDFVGGYGSEPGFFRWAPGRDVPVERVPDHGTKSSIKKIVRSIALVRYVKAQLGVSLQSLFGYSQGSAPTSCAVPRLEPGDSGLIESVTRTFSQAAGAPPSHVIFIFDPDIHPLHAQRLMGGRSLCPTRDSLARKLLAQSAAEVGIHVIDMQPIFVTYVASTREPIDFPDSHWNAVGNRLAARAIAEVIVGANGR
jgi:SGNH hydrolase-like domain, acetyltransferase AlgX